MEKYLDIESLAKESVLHKEISEKTLIILELVQEVRRLRELLQMDPTNTN